MTNKTMVRLGVACVQLAGTLVILFLLENTLLITVLLLIWWGITFYPFSKQDILLFVITCIIFAIVDILVLQQGIFAFRDKDIFGMPYYELFMWGFYFLHTSRLLKGDVSPRILPGLVFAILVMIAVSIPVVPVALLVGAFIVVLGLFYFRTKKDLQYTLYLLSVGLVIEYTGTQTQTWSYSIDNYIVWWIVTWSASGLILYRAVMPLVEVITNRAGCKSA